MRHISQLASFKIASFTLSAALSVALPSITSASELNNEQVVFMGGGGSGSCKSTASVSGTTTARPVDAGKVVIASWSRAVSDKFGSDYADFKRARDIRVNCRQIGSNTELQCVAVGTPCAN